VVAVAVQLILAGINNNSSSRCNHNRPLYGTLVLLNGNNNNNNHSIELIMLAPVIGHSHIVRYRQSSGPVLSHHRVVAQIGAAVRSPPRAPLLLHLVIINRNRYTLNSFKCFMIF
jgi:hypothetical protein